MLATLHRLPVGFALTGTKADERTVLLDILHTDSTLNTHRAAQIRHRCRVRPPPSSPTLAVDTDEGQFDLKHYGGTIPAGVLAASCNASSRSPPRSCTTAPASPSNGHCWPTTTDPLESITQMGSAQDAARLDSPSILNDVPTVADGQAAGGDRGDRGSAGVSADEASGRRGFRWVIVGIMCISRCR